MTQVIAPLTLSCFPRQRKISNFLGGLFVVAAIWSAAMPCLAAVPDAPAGYGWHQLANTNMTSVCLGNVPNGMYSDPSMTTTTKYNFDCYQIIPWSSGAADDKNQRLIVWGGGHSDYAGNEVSALNLNGTPAW